MIATNQSLRRTDASRRVMAAIGDAIASGGEIGLQVAAYRDGELLIDCWGGFADPTTLRPVGDDTLFNVFSVTKAVTATALHIQVDRGLVSYDARVVEYWPEFGAHGKAATTVRDILSHRSGLPQMPRGVTPELMCDWDWMTAQIAELTPLAAPGSKAMYQSMTFGWLVGEIVRRTDGRSRSFGSFVRDEIAVPLSIPDLWIGLPRQHHDRVAKLSNATPPIPPDMMPPLYRASMPPQVDLIPEVFERDDVRQADIAGVGGVFTARSCARFWAMLAQGGELDGVRLLSESLVARFNTPRPDSDQPDEVMFGLPLPLTDFGFWLGADHPPLCSVGSARSICHPGAGNTIAWADRDTRLAVAICHNRMFQPRSRESDTILPIADAVRSALDEAAGSAG
jgi:CubicO group peptidase (beta-lactamase class C family)